MNETDKIRLAIIDDNAEDCYAFSKFFSSCPEIEICKAFTNVDDGLKNISKIVPNLVLTDFIMPDMDGSQVIKNIKSIYNEKVKVIVLSGVNDSKIINEAFRCGADYYLLKPISPTFLKERIISIFNKNEEYKFKGLSINKFVKDIGIPIGLSGYDYAIDAINIMLKSAKGIMLKEINSLIAQKNYTSIQCVDACLHNAIKKAHYTGNEQYKNLFGNARKCPSNYVFLRVIREYIKINSSILA